MTTKPCRVLLVKDVKHVVVSANPAEGAIIRLAMPDEADVDLKLSAQCVAKLEALLARANVEQAKGQMRQ